MQLNFKAQPFNKLREKFPLAGPFEESGRVDSGRVRLSEEGFKLLSGLLTLNPDKRLTAAEALQSKWCASALLLHHLDHYRMNARPRRGRNQAA